MARTQYGIVVASAVAAALALSACSGGHKPSADGSGSSGPAHYAKGGTFTIALASDPGNLDPSMTPSSVARNILGLTYDTLVYQKADGTVVSGLADKWTTTPTSVTFTLRKGVTCADGSQLTATDVAKNIDFIANPKNNSPLTGVLVHEGTTTKADDATNTVTVTAPSPNGFLLTELSGLFIICGKGLADYSALQHTPDGTGPWTLSQAVPNDHYTFKPHQGYTWGPDGTSLTGPGIPDEVNVRVIPNVTTTANLLLTGQLNMGAVSGPDTARLTGKFSTIDTIDTAGETWFNQAPGHPGADPAVREALTTGSDMTALSKVATGNNGQPSKGFITLEPNPCTGGDTVTGNLPSYDVEKAKKILDDAGWVPGSDGIRAKDGKQLAMTFAFDPQGLSSRSAGVELLAQQWKALGVKVTIKSQPEAQLNNLFFSTGAWDAAWADFTFNLPSQMVAFVSGDAPPNGSNFSHIVNPDYSKLVAEAITKVGTAGCSLWADAEKALLKGYNLIPMFDSISRTYVKNAQLTAPGGQIWGSTLRLLAG